MKRIVVDPADDLWSAMEAARTSGDLLLPHGEPRGATPGWPSSRAGGLVVRSSGTTGKPKFMFITWPAMEARIESGIETLGLRADDVACTDMPPAALPETYQLGAGVLRLGGRHYDRGDLLPGETFAQMCERVGCTVILAMAGDRHNVFWLEPPTTAPVRMINFFGSESVEYMLRNARRWAPQARVASYYGIREVGACTLNWGRTLEGEVGRAWSGVELRIVDDEIWVRFAGNAAEYSDGSPVCDADGWFHTRDGGHMRGDVLHTNGRLGGSERDRRGVTPKKMGKAPSR